MLAANDQYPGNVQDFFAFKIVLAANHQYPENIRRHFCLQAALQQPAAIIQ